MSALGEKIMEAVDTAINDELRQFDTSKFSREVGAVAKDMEVRGLIRWVGRLYGTDQYALTDKGVAARNAIPSPNEGETR